MGMEGGGDMDKLGLFPTFISSQNTSVRGHEISPSFDTGVFNAKAISNKTSVLQVHIKSTEHGPGMYNQDLNDGR